MHRGAVKKAHVHLYSPYFPAKIDDILVYTCNLKRKLNFETEEWYLAVSHCGTTSVSLLKALVFH